MDIFEIIMIILLSIICFLNLQYLFLRFELSNLKKETDRLNKQSNRSK